MTYFHYDERGRGLDRIVSFSDGVFAIAITLLVLNFRLPHVASTGTDNRLYHALLDESDTFGAFVASFYVIARYWMVHHRLSIFLRRVDTRFIGLNLVFLATVVFLPFPTEVLGVYGDTVTGIVFYGAAMTLTGVLSTAVWQYAYIGRLLDPRLTPAWHRAGWVRGLTVPVIFATSIPIAFLDTSLARYWWLLLFLQRPVTRWLAPEADQPFGPSAAAQ